MLEQPEVTEPADKEPVDRYGGVALGVECAWPQSIPTHENSTLSG
jgi:hypothetical protein